MIRAVLPGDLAGLKAVIEATGLFPADMLDDMTAAYFRGEEDGIWLTDAAPDPVAVAYCAPERMASGTWNLYLIAVHPAWQRRRRGSTLIAHVERLLAERGERVLLVETSGLPLFQGTRDFYRRQAFEEEARIRDFYNDGEDKVVFRKVLSIP